MEDTLIWHGEMKIINGYKDKEILLFLVCLRIQSILVKTKDMNYRQINFFLLNLDMILLFKIIVIKILKVLAILAPNIKFQMG